MSIYLFDQPEELKSVEKISSSLTIYLSLCIYIHTFTYIIYICIYIAIVIFNMIPACNWRQITPILDLISTCLS